MYDELVKRLREPCQYENCVLCKEAADVIEERDRYALTLQHEMMAEAESHIALVERLNKQVEELQKQVAHWQRELAKSMCEVTLRDLEKPRWIPVTERPPEDGEDVLCWISDNRRSGQGYEMVGCYNSTLKLWDMDADWVSSLDITHWRTLPAPPKEEE